MKKGKEMKREMKKKKPKGRRTKKNSGGGENWGNTFLASSLLLGGAGSGNVAPIIQNSGDTDHGCFPVIQCHSLVDVLTSKEKVEVEADKLRLSLVYEANPLGSDSIQSHPSRYAAPVSPQSPA